MYMDFEKEKCPELEVDGIIAGGKQFDLDITIPEDNRDVIYGVIRDCYKEPVQDAVVKLVEIEYYHDKKVRKPVSHTFTDKQGEFVFGPLCPNRVYEINFWADKVKHIKMCAKCTHEGECLKGTNKKCDCFMDDNNYYDDKKDYEEDCKKEEEKDCNCSKKQQY